MLCYNGTPETVYYFNWIMHSGQFNLQAYLERARRKPQEMGEGTPEEYLACSLHNRLVNSIHKAFPLTDADLQFDDCVQEEDYIGPEKNKLLAPLLSLMLARIDFDAIARFILAREADKAALNH
jgi:hypothetical protein